MKQKRKQKQKRVYQQKMWDAAKFYCTEANKAHKAKAYFCALVARCCELEALLRIFDFVETRRPKDRCRDLYRLINRAFAKHWIPHDALRWWKQAQETPLKPCPHEIREARNGVHAHLFQKDLFTRRTASNVTYLVHSMYDALEIENARNLMWSLYEKAKSLRRNTGHGKKRRAKSSSKRRVNNLEKSREPQRPTQAKTGA